jgi:hypothetical protein
MIKLPRLIGAAAARRAGMALALATGPALAQDVVPLPQLLPRELEIELALSAVPANLRAGAAVMVLQRGGYVDARKGTNGFTCLVRRMGAVPGNFYDGINPVCWDAEGVKTVFQSVLDEVKMIEEGVPAAKVRERIAEGWKSGRYKPPGPGVSYMLSPVFHFHVSNGRAISYVPHTMFYAPFRTDADVGADGNPLGYVPYIQAPGLGSAVMVVPVGERERARIYEEGRDLIERTRPFMPGAVKPPGIPEQPR